MYCREIIYGTPCYAEAVALRDQVLREPLHLEFTQEQISDEYRVYHIAAFANDGQIAGILIGQPIEDKAGMIKIRQVAVDPKRQKQGVGSILMAYAEKYFAHLGYETCVLNSRVVAVPFYIKCDYEAIGEEFMEVGIPHLKMVKRLVQK